MTYNNRRKFLRASGLTGLGLLGMTAIPTHESYAIPQVAEDNQNIIGPRQGYTPHIGSMVSMLYWMRHVMLRSVEGMGVGELDYLLDDEANSIGSMLFHLAATDKWYYLNSFKGVDANNIFSHKEFREFRNAMELGNAARKEIKGHELSFYLDKLETTREATLAEFKNRDDEWLMAADESFPWGPTNNYCKWFHVCEHESNHNGQIKLIRSRIVT